MTKASGDEPDRTDLRIDAREATRSVVVSYTPPDFEIQVLRPDWVSPHEAWAMLDAAATKIEAEVPEWEDE